MPTGSWRARSMLASSYCCPEKPFVLKIRPFVLKIQPLGKFPLVWAWWRSRILHRVVCTLLDNLDGVLPATMSPVHRCIEAVGTFVASYQYRAKLPWRLPSRRGGDASELTQPLSSPSFRSPHRGETPVMEHVPQPYRCSNAVFPPPLRSRLEFACMACCRKRKRVGAEQLRRLGYNFSGR